MSSDSYPPGSLRAKDDQGNWMVARPHDPSFSTMTMVATEYWNAEDGQWKPIFDDNESTT